LKLMGNSLCHLSSPIVETDTASVPRVRHYFIRSSLQNGGHSGGSSPMQLLLVSLQHLVRYTVRQRDLQLKECLQTAM
jgi:hypothetical protein